MFQESAEPIGIAIGWALSPRKFLGPAMQAEFEGHARVECFWARDVPGAKESMGSIADRIRTGEVGDASEPGSSTRFGRIAMPDCLSAFSTVVNGSRLVR